MSEAAPRLIIVHAAEAERTAERLSASRQSTVSSYERGRPSLNRETTRLLGEAARYYSQITHRDQPAEETPLVYVPPPIDLDDDQRSMFHQLSIRELTGQSSDFEVPAHNILNPSEASLAKARRSPVEHIAHIVDELYGDRSRVPLAAIAERQTVLKLVDQYEAANLRLQVVRTVDKNGVVRFYEKNGSDTVDNATIVA